MNLTNFTQTDRASQRIEEYGEDAETLVGNLHVLNVTLLQILEALQGIHKAVINNGASK